MSLDIVGIIAEFNPFHKGHQYIIEKAKSETGATHCIIAMSGDYMQRGEAAIISKYPRCQMALSCGADAVFMLPLTVSTASAQYYARGGVAMLAALGAKYIYFASEDGDLSLLTQKQYEPGSIDSPNNILAREYIEAIRFLNLNITPMTTKRIGSGYNEDKSVINGISSASYIRTHLKDNPSDISSIKDYIPEACHAILSEYLKNHNLVFNCSYNDAMFTGLIMNQTNKYSAFFDVYPDLSDKIASNLYQYKDLDSFISLLKSKDITYSHIVRALYHILLDITDNDIDILKSHNYAPYARLLGFKKSSEALIGSVLNSASIPVLTKLSEYTKNVPEDIAMLISKDINASHLYAYISGESKSGTLHEFTKPLVIIP